MSLIWPQITSKLEIELPSKEFNTWIRPLQTIEQNKTLTLLAPNHFVLEWVHEHYLPRIQEIVVELKTELTKVQIEIGSKQHQIKRKSGLNRPVAKKKSLKTFSSK